MTIEINVKYFNAARRLESYRRLMRRFAQAWSSAIELVNHDPAKICMLQNAILYRNRVRKLERYLKQNYHAN